LKLEKPKILGHRRIVGKPFEWIRTSLRGQPFERLKDEARENRILFGYDYNKLAEIHVEALD
jgi:hypothetical protein